MADWDERYSRGEHIIKGPLPLLVELAPKLNPGRALDLACGTGRHAIFLAERGWHVTAVDGSTVGIELAKDAASAKDLEIEWIVADLERHEFEIEPSAYDLIGDFYYLQRDLFPKIRSGVRPGGIVIAAIHTIDDSPDVKPMNPDFLLQPGELRAAFSGWDILHDYEGKANEDGHYDRRTAEIVARSPVAISSK